MKKVLAVGLGTLLLTGCMPQATPTPTNVNTNTTVSSKSNMHTNNSNAQQQGANTLIPAATSAKAPAAKAKRYTGSWFSILVPAGFEASPALEAEDRVETEDARFTSPDGAVEFYVYSPQWGGTTDYFGLAAGEVMADESVTEKGEGLNATTMEYKTVRAKDGSYTRSTVFISKGEADAGSMTQHGFGIRYKDQASYDKYKEAYMEFKESLEQYAD